MDLTEEFDAHDYCHGLDLLDQGSETMRLANRHEFRCPACEGPFDRLFVSERRHHTFGAPSGPFCLARTDEQLLVLTH